MENTLKNIDILIQCSESIAKQLTDFTSLLKTPALGLEKSKVDIADFEKVDDLSIKTENELLILDEKLNKFQSISSVKPILKKIVDNFSKDTEIVSLIFQKYGYDPKTAPFSQNHFSLPTTSAAPQSPHLSPKAQKNPKAQKKPKKQRRAPSNAPAKKEPHASPAQKQSEPRLFGASAEEDTASSPFDALTPSARKNFLPLSDSFRSERRPSASPSPDERLRERFLLTPFAPKAGDKRKKAGEGGGRERDSSSPFGKSPSLADFGLGEYERRESLSKSRRDGSAESNASSARLKRRLSRDFRKVPLFARDDPDFASFCFRREQALAEEGGGRAEVSILEKELSERYGGGSEANSSL